MYRAHLERQGLCRGGQDGEWEDVGVCVAYFAEDHEGSVWDLGGRFDAYSVSARSSRGV